MLEIFWRKKTYQVKSEIDAFVDIDAYAEIEKNHAKLQDENKRLKERERLLIALEATGVDNWEGYDAAIDIMGES